MTDVAPILLFTYKRLETLKKTIEALQENYLALDSSLFIFSDAAKNPNDQEVISNVRKYLRSVTGFKSVVIIEAEKNKGLASSILTGVNYVLETYDKVIVLEDDLSTTRNFLAFMNTCLNKYETQRKVFSISGYAFNLGEESPDLNDAYFINRGWSWGWATWKDRWSKVDWDVSDYDSFKRDRRAKKQFARGGSDLNKMLHEQMTGKIDSWAIRWFYSQYKLNGLTIYPIYSKVFNNGFDDVATHTNGSEKRYLPNMDRNESLSFKLPNVIEVNAFFQEKFSSKMGIKARIVSKFQTLIKKFLV